MTIPFVPPRGRILICDFSAARISPEMSEIRRVVVISPRSYNTRHGENPGRCLVVPFSMTPPHKMTPAYVAFEAGTYASLSEPTFAVCPAITLVSHRRLDSVNVGGTNLHEQLTAMDIARIIEGIRYAVGIV